MSDYTIITEVFHQNKTELSTFRFNELGPLSSKNHIHNKVFSGPKKNLKNFIMIDLRMFAMLTIKKA